jgi:hypothetical protein
MMCADEVKVMVVAEVWIMIIEESETLLILNILKIPWEAVS